MATYTLPSKLHGYGLWDVRWLAAAARGLRNGITTGVQIRTPYLMQAAIYALVFRDAQSTNKLRFVFKQMFHHGRNLGTFVLLYKALCTLLRHCNVRGGAECWLAGGIAGYVGFGESRGISGAVNNQIVLYLFARGVEGMLATGVANGSLPKALDVRSPQGFRFFAGFSLALILYLTDYQAHHLKRGFMATMDHLYYESNSGPLLPARRFAPFVAIVLLSFLAYFSPAFSLDNLISFVDRIGPHQRKK